MDIKKTQLKPSELELTIEISQAEYQPFLIKAATRLSQSSKIEGFRPGKAPYEIVKQRVGEMAIYQEALDEIIPHFFYQAVKQENLNTILQPKIEIEKLALSNPIVFKAIIALMPKVKLGHYKNISAKGRPAHARGRSPMADSDWKVQKKEAKVEDSEVEKAIQDIRKMQAKEILVERAAQTGDRTEVDFEVSLDKVVIEGGQGKKYPLVLGSGSMIPGFEEQLIGLKAGEEKTFQLKFPEQYQNKMVAGKYCDFKVKMLAVYERDLPKADDEWAKTLGMKSVVELKFKIKENLLAEKNFNNQQRQEIELLNKVVAQAEFSEIPERLIESEAHRMVHEFSDSISEQGINFTDYLQSIKKTEKELEADFKPKALERVKTSLVIKEIADQEKIEVSAADLQQETEHILSEVRGNSEAEENVKGEGYQHYLMTVIRNRKVIEMLKKEIIQ